MATSSAHAQAFPAPVASPPQWTPQWVTAIQETAIFSGSQADEVLGGAPAGAYFRLDAPALDGRFWAYNPRTDGWGWVPELDVSPAYAPSADDVLAPYLPPDPRTYMYQNWPQLAPRMDCVIQVESRWDPYARNPYSTASGLAQFLNTTWARTPQGQAGLSPFDPYANIDAFAWMVQGGGSWSEWQAVTWGYC